MPTHTPVYLDRVLSRLKNQIRPEQIDTWFRGFSLKSETEGEVEFSVPSGFVRDWLNRNFHEQIRLAVAAQDTEEGRQGSRKVRISLDSSLLHADESLEAAASGDPRVISTQQIVPDLLAGMNQTGSAPQAEAAALNGHPSSPPAGIPAVQVPSVQVSNVQGPNLDRLLAETPLNKNYTFEQFVVGPSNQLPHAASLAVGQNPGRAYNPLFIHGNVGLGKTHLLQSICHSIKRRPQAARVVYLSCEEFTNRFILAIQSGKLDAFREHYRSADVLVLDDVQFLAGKDKTQEEFFHTFNALYNAQKQIVISSDRPPVEIPTVEERLVSRFKWGLVTDIQEPCLDTRLTIIRRKAQMRKVELPDDVVDYVAQRVTSNIREVEGAVIKVICVAAITERPISVELAQEALLGNGGQRQHKITVQDVINMVTSEFSITAKDLIGKSRTQKISLPRQIAMFLSRQYTDHSLEDIGKHFGNRDHTTVLYAVDKIKTRTKSDKMLSDLLQRLSNRLETGQGV